MADQIKQVDKVTKAYVYEVQQNSVDSHQSNPGYVLTFVRFSNRDTFRNTSSSSTETRNPLVVVSDAVDVGVDEQKSSLNKKMSCTLLGGDINYEAAVAPGDYVIVNMLEDQTLVMNIRERAINLQAINNFTDGFKGVFRVQSVHRTHVIDEETGIPHLAFTITGFSHAEMGDVIYFNPYMITQAEQSDVFMFLTSISKNWNLIIGKDRIANVQDIMILLFQCFLGRGINQQGRYLREGLLRTENNLYIVPVALGKLLNHPKAKYIADVTNIYAGIQNYANTGIQVSPQVGLNPTITSRDGTVARTGDKVQGASYAMPEFWNQIKVEQILKQYLNECMNEIYTCIKPDPITGSMLPTIVIRQKPFTSNGFDNRMKKLGKSINGGTKFLNLPRWRIHPDRMVGNFSIGRDDARRINFVQIFGKSQAFQNSAESQGASTAAQIAAGNYAVDTKDIERSGLRPYITESPFDYDSSGTSARVSRTPQWAQIIGDWLIGGHLKLSGSTAFAGIQAPITVGDNAQVDGVVYHIEGMSHRMMIGITNGKKSFRTTLNLSEGVMSDAYLSQSIYGEMNQPNADARRKWTDDQNLDTLVAYPGSSDTQSLPNRFAGEKGHSPAGDPFGPEAVNPNALPPVSDNDTIKGGGTSGGTAVAAPSFPIIPGGGQNGGSLA